MGKGPARAVARALVLAVGMVVSTAALAQVAERLSELVGAGSSAYAVGDIPAAIAAFGDAAELSEKELGARDQTTIALQNNVVALRRAAGDIAAAINLSVSSARMSRLALANNLAGPVTLTARRISAASGNMEVED